VLSFLKSYRLTKCSVVKFLATVMFKLKYYTVDQTNI
jgi:hypothetical protein